jgi:hypothetical protein
MSLPLFLFCGGPALYDDGRPKPLMQVGDGCSLLALYLQHLQRRPCPPVSVTLLCDEDQVDLYFAELAALSVSLPLRVRPCGPRASTLEKFEYALREQIDTQAVLRFGYPDIFYFGQEDEPAPGQLAQELVHISAAALSSRFPRLVIDVFTSRIKSISNHSAAVPANPMHVFGGDLWGRVDVLRALCLEFRGQASNLQASLEYDLFFWMINHKKLRCVILHGQRLWVDSLRDVHRLQQITGELL